MIPIQRVASSSPSSPTPINSQVLNHSKQPELITFFSLSFSNTSNSREKIFPTLRQSSHKHDRPSHHFLSFFTQTIRKKFVQSKHHTNFFTNYFIDPIPTLSHSSSRLWRVHCHQHPSDTVVTTTNDKPGLSFSESNPPVTLSCTSQPKTALQIFMLLCRHLFYNPNRL